LRVIGCKLSQNDWDLISLLFATKHVRSSGSAYEIEIINAPNQAEEIKRSFPYLGVKSMLEVEQIGEALVGEFSGGGPRKFSSLTEAEKSIVLTNAGWSRNWFHLWLKHKAEALFENLGSVRTPNGTLNSLLGAAS
jgi:hypothetical protein